MAGKVTDMSLKVARTEIVRALQRQSNGVADVATLVELINRAQPKRGGRALTKSTADAALEALRSNGVVSAANANRIKLLGVKR